jgi:platelet-activating factor acetylhydrolase
MAAGYGHFSTVGTLGIPVFLPTMFTKLPAFRNAPISNQYPPDMDPGHEDQKSGETTEEEDRDEKHESDDAPPKFPLMIFSHGLGGTKTAYSSVCGEVCSIVLRRKTPV